MNESMFEHEEQPCGTKASQERHRDSDMTPQVSHSAPANWTVGAAESLFPASHRGRMLCPRATSQRWKSHPRSGIRAESSGGVNPLYSV